MCLLEFANLLPENTGLTSGIIYIYSTDPGTHSQRVKFFREITNRSCFASIEIVKDVTPKILIDKIDLTKQEKQEIFRFIKLNYDVLMKFWNHGVEMYIDEVNDLLDDLKKI